MSSPEKEQPAHDAAEKRQILDDIEQYGCHLALLAPTDYMPGFAYSIGLYRKFGHPELICFGLQDEILGAVLNHACDLIKGGETFKPGKFYGGFLQGYDVQFIEVDKSYYPNYAGYGISFYDGNIDFPLYQLVWPDTRHRWPWEKSFNPDWKRKEPLLDRNTDFKFYEERNVGVFTTSQAYEGHPILHVYHNNDGSWQFHTSLEPSIDDVMIVSLEQITKLDPTINEVFHLDYGWRAWRSSHDAPWHSEEDPREEEPDDE